MTGGSVFAMGPMLRERQALLGTWATESLADDVVSIAEGLKALLGERLTLESSALTDLSFQQARDADVVLVALGESDHSSGEAKSVAEPVLPAGQLELLRRLKCFGKKVVTLVCAGRPLAIPEVDELSDALLYCWQGGVEAGPAIARVLCGLAQPAGRLPVTLPRHPGQIPLYYNHKSNGRAIDEYYGDVEYPNYVDVPGSPLYPFGFGLTYTQFSYGGFRAEVRDGAAHLRVTVRNIGSRPGCEVVQCYVQDCLASVTLPVRQLKGYRRLTLQPGEEAEVCFPLTPEQLSFYDAAGRLVFEPGEFRVWVGPDCLRGLEGRFTL